MMSSTFAQQLHLGYTTRPGRKSVSMQGTSSLHGKLQSLAQMKQTVASEAQHVYGLMQ